MSDYKNLDANEVAKRLLDLKSVVVLMHARPDGDTIGSASALIKILKRLGITAEYACSDNIPDRLKFLLSGENAASTFEGRELIAIDVASKAQLGSLSEFSDKVLFTIDHHSVNSPFSDNYTMPDASSAGEVLFTVLLSLTEMGKCSLDKEIAYPLYASISSDTGGFLFSNATPTAYKRAALLMETGIDFSDINHRLFHSKSKNQIKAEGFIASNLKTAFDGAVTYATLSKAERSELMLESEHFETAIDVIRSVMGTKIALFVRENDDGSFKASIRSTGHNVAEIAARFGGGGHVRAAGCSIADAKDVFEAADKVLHEIKSIL